MRRQTPLYIVLVLLAGQVGGGAALGRDPGRSGVEPTWTQLAADYYVNKNAQDTGEHEVHREGCSYLPKGKSRIALGKFTNCRDALHAAQRIYAEVDGCYYCSFDCHTR